VDVERAADLYAQGWTLRQIGAELGVHWSTVSQQLESAGITIRSGGPSTHPASTEQIIELHDQGLTWSEVAKQVATIWRTLKLMLLSQMPGDGVRTGIQRWPD
jgi:hypothetical protein